MVRMDESEKSLKFSVSAVREKNGMTADRLLPPSVFDGALRKDSSLGEVAIHVDFSVGENSILAVGSVKAAVKTFCDRCYSEYEKKISETFDETFDLSENEIDLKNLVYDILAMTEEVRNLCSEDCRGLCPGCGVNLNTKTCGCRNEAPSAFSALLEKAVKEKKEK